MATTEKVLGQLAPNATTEGELYKVPAATSAVVTSIIVCNRAATATTFRISVDVGDTGTANTDYLYYDYTIEGNMTVRLDKLQLTLAATDSIQVYAGTANLSFNAFGSERT